MKLEDFYKKLHEAEIANSPEPVVADPTSIGKASVDWPNWLNPFEWFGDDDEEGGEDVIPPFENPDGYEPGMPVNDPDDWPPIDPDGPQPPPPNVDTDGDGIPDGYWYPLPPGFPPGYQWVWDPEYPWIPNRDMHPSPFEPIPGYDVNGDGVVDERDIVGSYPGQGINDALRGMDSLFWEWYFKMLDAGWNHEMWDDIDWNNPLTWPWNPLNWDVEREIDGGNNPILDPFGTSPRPNYGQPPA